MISVFILAIAFIPILRLVDFSAVSTARVGNIARASRLAQQLIEECKHVPFRVYQEHYTDLDEGDDFSIHPQFYQETAASIEDFFTDNRDSFRNYGVNANLRVRKNDLDDIVEVWFEVEIYWRQLGDKDDDSLSKSLVRASNAYYNSEAF